MGLTFEIFLKTFLALGVTIVCWTVGAIFIESAGVPQTSLTTGYVTYVKDYFLLGMRWYHLFGLLWITQFVIACQHVVIAGAIAGWYFAK